MRVHRFAATAAATPVNAYLVEGTSGVLAVDTTLTVSTATELRARADALGKPLAGVVVTHAHPDHYGGLTHLLAGREVPIYATAGVDRVIRRDDEVKEQILRPMFGDEWAHERTFPNTHVRDGETIELGGVRLTVVDLGPGESPHDSVWVLDGPQERVFTGDQVYSAMHCYLADGFYEQWLANLARLRGTFTDAATFYVGHGDPAAPDALAWQAGYIEAFVGAVRDADWHDPDAARASVVATMKGYLAADDLRFLMELSIDPMAQRLGVVAPA